MVGKGQVVGHRRIKKRKQKIRRLNLKKKKTSNYRHRNGTGYLPKPFPSPLHFCFSPVFQSFVIQCFFSFFTFFLLNHVKSCCLFCKFFLFSFIISNLPFPLPFIFIVKALVTLCLKFLLFFCHFYRLPSGLLHLFIFHSLLITPKLFAL